MYRKQGSSKPLAAYSEAFTLPCSKRMEIKSKSHGKDKSISDDTEPHIEWLS
jgi:hypothetical protein